MRAGLVEPRSVPRCPWLKISKSPLRGCALTREELEMNLHQSWIHRHRLGAFLVLAFGLSWWPWPLALVEPDSEPMVWFGPLIAPYW